MNDYTKKIDRLFFDTLKIPENSYCTNCPALKKNPIMPYVGKLYGQSEQKVLFVGTHHNTEAMDAAYIIDNIDNINKPAIRTMNYSIKNVFEYPAINHISYIDFVLCNVKGDAVRTKILEQCVEKLNAVFGVIKILKPTAVIFILPEYLYELVDDLSSIATAESKIIEVTKKKDELEEAGYSFPFWERRITNISKMGIGILVLNEDVDYRKFTHKVNDFINSKDITPETVIGKLLSDISTN